MCKISYVLGAYVLNGVFFIRYKGHMNDGPIISDNLHFVFASRRNYNYNYSFRSYLLKIRSLYISKYVLYIYIYMHVWVII